MKQMEQSKVSVCMPIFNNGEYLAEALESVIGQSYSNMEILVFDDSSSDGSAGIVRDFQGRDLRITYRRNMRNLGMVRNWNLCLHEARGRYIKFLFGDDVLSDHDAIAILARALDADPSVSLVGSARKVINNRSEQTGCWSFAGKNSIIEGVEVITTCLKNQGNPIGEPSSVMFRKEQAKRGFDEKYCQLVDLEMWFHLLEKGKYAYCATPLCSFRVHKDQQTARNQLKPQAVFDTTYLLEDYLDRPYVKFSSLLRQRLRYDNAYQVWKLYQRKGLLTKQQAMEKIGLFFDFRVFLLLLPLFKTYKQFSRLRKLVA